MEMYRIGLLFVIAFILQVSALSSDPEVNRVQKHHSHTLVDVSKSSAILKSFYVEARTTLDKFQKCGTATHLEMFRLVALKLSDFQACVNATSEIAEYEEFLYHFYYYAKFVGSTVVYFVKDIFSCRHQSGIFQILNCTVTEIQNSGPAFDEILTKAKDLIGEVQTDTDDLILYIKRCLGYSTSELLVEMHNLINKC